MRQVLMLCLLPILACESRSLPASMCDRTTCEIDASLDLHANHQTAPGSTDDTRAPGPETCLERVAILDGAGQLTTSTDWAPSDDYALTGGIDEIRLLRIDTAAGTIQKLDTYHGQEGRPVAWWSPNGKFALSASHDLRLLRIQREPGRIEEVSRLEVGKNQLLNIAWSKTGEHAVVTGVDVQLFAVDAARGTLTRVATYHGHEGRVFMSSWSPDGTHLLTAGEDHTARLLAVDRQARTIREVTLYEADDMVTVVAWHPTDSIALVGTWLGGSTLKLLSIDVRNGRLTERGALSSQETHARAIAWTPDGKHAVWSGHNGTPHLCTLQSAKAAMAPLSALPSDATGVHELS